MGLQKQRQRAGLSQSELAAKSGVNIRSIQQYEIGARNLDGASLETLCKLCAACDCKLYDIIESNDLRKMLKSCT